MLFSEEDLKKKLEQLQTDKAKNEKEYAEWQASCEAWKKSHANHPNKELFNKYNEEVLIFIDKVIRISKICKKDRLGGKSYGRHVRLFYIRLNSEKFQIFIFKSKLSKNCRISLFS